MSKFEDIELFCQIVESKSFTAVAAELGVSRGLVSKRLTDLERRLGVSLIARSTRRLSTTEAGQDFYDRCREIAQRIQEADAHAKGISDFAHGVVKVTAPTLLGWRLLPNIVTDLLATNTELTVDYLLSDQYVDIIGDGFDIAVRMGPHLEDSNLLATKVGSTEIVICGSPDYFAQNGKPVTTRDLFEHECLSFGSWGGFGRVWKFADSAKPKDVRIKGKMISNSDLTLLAACRMGAGLVYTPRICIEDELASGELIVVLESFTRGLDRGIYAIFPNLEFKPKKVSVFVEFLKQQLSSLS